MLRLQLGQALLQQHASQWAYSHRYRCVSAIVGLKTFFFKKGKSYNVHYLLFVRHRIEYAGYFTAGKQKRHIFFLSPHLHSLANVFALCGTPKSSEFILGQVTRPRLFLGWMTRSYL